MSKETKNAIPEGFTLSMVLVDALPVIFFSIAYIIMALNFPSPLFIIGAIACAAAGLCKVLWKLIVVVSKKNIPILAKQMRILMPAGFLLMIVGLIVDRRLVSFPAIWAGITGMPAVIFFVLGVLGMGAMGVLASKLDSSSAKANWIEQLTNTFAQGCILLGVICAFYC